MCCHALQCSMGWPATEAATSTPCSLAMHLPQNDAHAQMPLPNPRYPLTGANRPLCLCTATLTLTCHSTMPPRVPPAVASCSVSVCGPKAMDHVSVLAVSMRAMVSWVVRSHTRMTESRALAAATCDEEGTQHALFDAGTSGLHCGMGPPAYPLATSCLMPASLPARSTSCGCAHIGPHTA